MSAAKDISAIVPLAGYPGSFTPFTGALKSGERYAPAGCLKQSEGALMLAGLSQPQTEIGEAVGVSRSLIAQWIGAHRFPAPAYQTALEAKFGIPAAAWSLWRPDPAARVEERAEEPAAPADPLTLPEDGSPAERARALLTFLATPGRTTAQLAQAREVRHALTLEARLGEQKGPGPLHEHADFDAWIDQLVAALAGVPGALDALDRWLRAGAEERRAA